MFQTRVVEQFGTRFAHSVFFLNLPVYEADVEKYDASVQCTDNNMAKSISHWIPKTTNTQQ